MTVATESKVGICLGCNYPLRGLPSRRCPECGREFDPDEPPTMNMGRPLTLLARVLLGPTGWPTVCLAIAPVLWLVWIARNPGMYYLLLNIFAAILFGVGSAFVMCVRLGLRMATATSFGQPQRPPGIREGATAAIVVLVVLAVVFRMPLYLGFLLSKSALDEFRRDLVEHPTAARPPVQWVGVYRMDTNMRTRQDGVLQFYLAGSFEDGFGYSVTPVEYAGINYGAGSYIGDNWYWFADD
jgi:hypothetical protein